MVDDKFCKSMGKIFRTLSTFVERAEELKTNTNTDYKARGIISMSQLPKVHMVDVSQNWEYLEAIIEQDNDEAFKNAPLMEKIFYYIDEAYEFRLSAQKEIGLRSSAHRLEGDKLRLIWAKFLRELRTQFSEDIWCFRLKTQFMAREEKKNKKNDVHAAIPGLQAICDSTPHVGIASDMQTIDDTSKSSRMASLDSLPEFPILDWNDHDMLVDVSADLASEERPPLPPPLEAPVEVVDVLSSQEAPMEVEATEGHLELAALDDEGYPIPTLSAELGDDAATLPEGLPIGMPKPSSQTGPRKRARKMFADARPAAAPADIGAYIDKLAAGPALNHKQFIARIGALKRRPAAATVKKRPAAAMPLTLEPEQIDNAEATLLKRCLEYITATTPTPRLGKKYVASRENTHLWQIQGLC